MPNKIDSLISIPRHVTDMILHAQKDLFRSAWEIIGKSRRMTLELINRSTRINNSDQCHIALTKSIEYHSTGQEVIIYNAKHLAILIIRDVSPNNSVLNCGFQYRFKLIFLLSVSIK